MTRSSKWAPHPEATRLRAVAMIRNGVTYETAMRETGAGDKAIRRWIAEAGVTYVPSVNVHRECANRRWADPRQRASHAEVGRRVMSRPGHRAMLSAAALAPEARRDAWESRNPHLAHFTSGELAEYRFLCRNKGLKRDEALAVMADAASRTTRKAA